MTKANPILALFSLAFVATACTKQTGDINFDGSAGAGAQDPDPSVQPIECYAGDEIVPDGEPCPTGADCYERDDQTLCLRVDSSAGGATSRNDAGQSGAAGAQGDPMDGDEPCVVDSTTPVDWTEDTELGTPETVFSKVPGTCTAPFSWDAGGWDGELTVRPATGESMLSATVAVDASSARLVKWKAGPHADSFGDAMCGTTLEVDATVDIELEDATVAKDQPVTISASDPDRITVDFSQEAAEFGDWVSVKAADENASPSMSFRMAPVAQGCAGQVMLGNSTSEGHSGTGVMQGNFASWTRTGCSVEQADVNLNKPFQGVDLRATLQDAFAEVEYSGAWEASGSTTVAIASSITETDVCADMLDDYAVVTVPMDITVSTADDRIRALAAAGTVRVAVHDNAVTNLEIGFSTDLVCASEDDTLQYRGAACASAKQVTAQLNYNSYADSSAPDEGRLELYVYDRESGAAPGAADRVDTLTLTPSR